MLYIMCKHYSSYVAPNMGVETLLWGHEMTNGIGREDKNMSATFILTLLCLFS